MRFYSAVVAAGVLPWIGVGCGDSGGPKPPMAKVRGKVLYGGKPLTKGTVTFVPIQGKGGETGQSASGTIESDGSFELTTFNTGDGAILGQHTAIVQVRDDPPPAASAASTNGATIPGQMPEFGGPNAYKPPKAPVPVRYTAVETSPLRYTVEKGTNDFSLDLKD